MADARKKRRYPLIEWVSAAIGLVVALLMFGFLAFEASRHDGGVPPLLDVAPVDLTFAGGRYVLEIEVSNESQATGASVAVEGTLKQGGADVETSTATLSYVPGESERRAGLVFTQDPRRHELELRVTGYELP